MKRDDKLAPQNTNFNTLMDQLCVGWGYCGSFQQGRFIHVTDILPKSGMVSAALFVECVMLAEGEAGMVGPRAMKWRQRIEAAFVAHMECEEVDAARLQYSVLAEADGIKTRNQLKDIKRMSAKKGKMQ